MCAAVIKTQPEERIIKGFTINNIIKSIYCRCPIERRHSKFRMISQLVVGTLDDDFCSAHFRRLQNNNYKYIIKPIMFLSSKRHKTLLSLRNSENYMKFSTFFVIYMKV